MAKRITTKGKVVLSVSQPVYMHLCCLSLCHDGALGIVRLIVSLFCRCITFCKECRERVWI